jgi:hypothetical protein
MYLQDAIELLRKLGDGEHFELAIDESSPHRTHGSPFSPAGTPIAPNFRCIASCSFALACSSTPGPLVLPILPQLPRQIAKARLRPVISLLPLAVMRNRLRPPDRPRQPCMHIAAQLIGDARPMARAHRAEELHPSAPSPSFTFPCDTVARGETQGRRSEDAGKTVARRRPCGPKYPACCPQALPPLALLRLYCPANHKKNRAAPP